MSYYQCKASWKGIFGINSEVSSGALANCIGDMMIAVRSGWTEGGVEDRLLKARIIEKRRAGLALKMLFDEQRKPNHVNNIKMSALWSLDWLGVKV